MPLSTDRLGRATDRLRRGGRLLAGAALALAIAVLAACGSASGGAPVVGMLTGQALALSGDARVLQVRFVRKDGAVASDPAAYDAVTVLTADAAAARFHRVGAARGADGRWSFTLVATAPPVGLDLGGIGSPRIDFPAALAIWATRGTALASTAITLAKPLTFPVPDHASYETVYADGLNGVTGVSAKDGTVSFRPMSAFAQR